MLGNNIQRVREEKGMGLNETARLAGISGSYLSNIERGIKTNPSIETIERIAKALDTTASDLMGFPVADYQNLYRLCTQTGITLDSLEKNLNLDPLSSSMIKEGVIPFDNALDLIANYFGVNVNYLTGKSYNPKIDERYDSEQLAKDVKSIENGIEKAKNIASTLPTIPEEFTSPEDARAYIKMHKIFGSEGFDESKMNDEEILDFANELLQQIKLVGYKYKR